MIVVGNYAFDLQGDDGDKSGGGDYDDDDAISPTQLVPHVVIQAYRQGW